MNDTAVLHTEDTFGKMPEPLIHDPNITDGAARQYAHLHWRAGKKERSWEGQPKMAEIFGLTRQTIANRNNELASHDWIVVVARISPKTGNYLTNIYHVFELQSSCREFRETYQPKQDEVVLPKPELTERKSRKGKGGNPKISELHAARRVNSGSQGNHVNSDLHGDVNSSSRGGVNSSSHNPDVFDPDSLEPDPAITPLDSDGSAFGQSPNDASQDETNTTAFNEEKILDNGDASIPPNPSSGEPLSPRKGAAHFGVYTALLSQWRYDPANVTKVLRSQFMGVASELHKVGVTPECVPDLFAYVSKRAQKERWKGWTVNVLPKYANDFLLTVTPKEEEVSRPSRFGIRKETANEAQ